MIRSFIVSMLGATCGHHRIISCCGEGYSEIRNVWKRFLIGSWWLDCCIVRCHFVGKKKNRDLMWCLDGWLPLLNIYIACYRIMLCWSLVWSFMLPVRFFNLAIVGLMENHSILDYQVTDEEGRRRFHGAFTGGFSAGYYNTVGSKEGRTECTFYTCIVLWYERHQALLVSMLITLQVGPLNPSRHHARREPN